MRFILIGLLIGIISDIVLCEPPTEPLTSRKAERAVSEPPSTADNVTVAADPIDIVV